MGRGERSLVSGDPADVRARGVLRESNVELGDAATSQ